MIGNFICKYFEEEKDIFSKLSLDILKKIIEKLWDVYERGDQIFVFGNGGSGSTASHFAGDMNKGVSFGLNKRFKVICLNDNTPTILAYANDTSIDNIFVEQLKNFMNPKDLVLAISGSGNSLNVIKAVQYSNEKHVTTISLTGFDGGKLAKLSSLSLVVPVNDMQKVEDFHLIVFHMIMQYFYQTLTKGVR